MSRPTTPPIVVGVEDVTRAEQALAWAAAEARLRRVPLRLVHAVPTHLYHPANPALADRLQEAGAQTLASAQARVQQLAPDVEVSTALPLESPALALIEESRGADTLVVSAPHHSRWGAAVAGSTTLPLAGHAQCPLVVVRGSAPVAPRGRVVLGVDGAEDGTEAVRFAFAFADRHGSSVVAVHAWAPPVVPTPLVTGMPDLHLDELGDSAEKVLEGALARARDQHPGVKVTEQVAQSHPVQVLLEAAEEADLVIVGARGRGGFAGLLLGSVSHALVHNSPCPVAVVRPEAAP